jgi:hypothetical protein
MTKIILNIEIRQVVFGLEELGDSYALKPVQYKSDSGVDYVLAATLSPYWFNSSTFGSYNFYVVVIRTTGMWLLSYNLMVL